MPEQTDYFDKYLQSQFNQINASMSELKTQFSDLRKEVRDENEATRKEVKEESEATRADNKATRRWIFGTVVGTGLTVLLGLAALLLTFVQIQNSWMQQVISFISKIVVK